MYKEGSLNHLAAVATEMFKLLNDEIKLALLNDKLKKEKKKFTSSRTVNVKSGHELCITACSGAALPIEKICENIDDFTHFYTVKNWDEEGTTFFFIAKLRGKKEYCVYYRNGQLWSSFGRSLKKACEGAMEDGWKYTL